MNRQEASDCADGKLVADQWGILTHKIGFLVNQVTRLHEQNRHDFPGTALAGDGRSLAYSVNTDGWRLIEQTTRHLEAFRELMVIIGLNGDWRSYRRPA